MPNNPNQEKCPRCDGYGARPQDAYGSKCPKCVGTGESTQVVGHRYGTEDGGMTTMFGPCGDCGGDGLASPIDNDIQVELEQRVRAILRAYGLGTVSEAEANGIGAITQLLTQTRQQADAAGYERAIGKQGRYCCVCFMPCYEYGGWKCEEHGYKSVYISRNEAEKCRAELAQPQSTKEQSNGE